MTGDITTLDHESARRLMAEAVEGKLDQTQERGLALHLVQCEECKRLYEGLQHAHPALASLAPGSPPTAAVDAAIFRATAILRGEADPGPMGLPPHETPPTTWLDTGPMIGDEAVESPGATPPKLADRTGAPPEPAETPAPAEETIPAERPSPPAPVLPSDEAPKQKPTVPAPVPPPVPPGPELPELPQEEPVPPPSRPSPPPPPIIEDEPAQSAPPPGPEPMSIDLEPPSRAPVRVGGAPSAETTGGRSRSEIEELLGQSEYEMRRKRPVPADQGEQQRGGVAGWLIAIAISIALAVIAVLLITQGQNLFGGGSDAPPAGEIKSGVAQQFTDLRSLKTSFNIQRLGLYRVERQDNSSVYTFSNGTYAGRIVYDRGEGYRQEYTLTATVEGQAQDIAKAEIVHRGDETRSVVGSETPPTVNVEKRPPLAPPDGQLKPQLGLLEDSIGSVVGLISRAETIEVLGTEKRNDRDVYKIRFAVQATELSRADRIDALLDSQSLVPVVIQRSISRENAQVLGPEQAVTDDVLNTAFGENDRITTEVVELDNVIIDDIILPGDFVLDTPEGTQTRETDFAFERVSRTDASNRLDFDPLFPRSLPEGVSEQQLAVYTGEPKAWGPNDAYPKPASVLNATYFDGKTTIAVSQRKVPAFDATVSPLQRGGLPITVRSVERDEKRFSYGVSPEVPPHVYGFLGEVFVVVSGYASEDELLDFIASLGPATSDVAAPVETPGGSPGAETTASPAAAPTNPPAP